MNDKTICLLILVAGIVILEGMALYKEVDGQILSVCIGFLSTLAGYIFGKRAIVKD